MIERPAKAWEAAKALFCRAEAICRPLARDSKFNRELTGRKRCFVSTAVYNNLAKPDDCRELQVLRNFRDTYKQATQCRRAGVDEYYRIAPLLVSPIEADPRRKTIWREVCDRFILPTVRAGETRQWVRAHWIYRRMVEHLSDRFLK